MNRQLFTRRLQRYSDMVIAPRLEQHPSLGQLQALRLYTLTGVLPALADMTLAERVAFLQRIERMSRMAPNNAPCPIGALDAWKLALDLELVGEMAA